jgi:hypothetical protein
MVSESKNRTPTDPFRLREWDIGGQVAPAGAHESGPVESVFFVAGPDSVYPYK